MSIQIKRITAEDLRGMEGQEGLILQGCGGDLQEWVDGINQELTEAGILLNDAKLDNVSVFQHDDVTCLEGKGSEFGEDADFTPYIGKGIIAVDASTVNSRIVCCIIIEDEEASDER